MRPRYLHARPLREPPLGSKSVGFVFFCWFPCWFGYPLVFRAEDKFLTKRCCRGSSLDRLSWTPSSCPGNPLDSSPTPYAGGHSFHGSGAHIQSLMASGAYSCRSVAAQLPLQLPLSCRSVATIKNGTFSKSRKLKKSKLLLFSFMLRMSHF